MCGKYAKHRPLICVAEMKKTVPRQQPVKFAAQG
jgi:hypothetical protein